MQIQPVKVLVNVSESDFTKVKVGMPVDVNVEVYGNEVFKGKVSLIHPTVDATTRTFVTEINIPNTDSRIRPGMFARVNIDFGDVDRVVVPDQAVVKRSGVENGAEVVIAGQSRLKDGASVKIAE